MAKFLVIGDSCIDVFNYFRVARLAPDLPIPILEESHSIQNSGMAANVARNLEALGHDVELLTNKNWQQMRKQRIVDRASNHTFLRIDTVEKPDQLQEIPALEPFDAVLVSDYDKGFLTPEIIEQIAKTHPRVFLDTKRKVSSWATRVYMLKVNEFEFEISMPTMPPELIERTVVTLGQKGALWDGSHFEGRLVEVKDVSGAGDTFFASFASAVVSGAGWPGAIDIANTSASEVISKIGVAVVNS